MSNAGNQISSLISVPKGGGALAGIGEKFTPDLHMGTGNLVLPLTLPAGRNGFQPVLELSYDSGQGQGVFGLGWALSVPGVRRKTVGVPRYRDAAPFDQGADVFLLSGAEDLVPVGTTPSGDVQFRPRTEGLFAEILKRSSGAGGHWRVRTKDGLVSYYGSNPEDGPAYPADEYDGPIEASSGDPSVAARPGRPDHVFAWNLTLTLDPFGNRIEYLYGRQASSAEDQARGHHFDVPVLKQIRYADRGTAGGRSFLVTVDFDYEPRPDPFSDYRAGFEQRSILRCRAMRVRTHLAESVDATEYRFSYRQDDKTLASLLRAVEIYGFDQAGLAVLTRPALELEYGAFEPEKPGRSDFFPLRGKELPAVSLATSTLELVDLHGQGLPDLVEIGTTARYWRNLGGGEFDLPRPLHAVPDGFPLGAPGVQLLDADGDGRMDLLIHRAPLSGYFPLRITSEPGRRPFRRYERAPSIDFGDPELRLFDLTGDGITDALRTGTRLECYFNDPEHGFVELRALERKALSTFPNVSFSDPRVLTGDMSGDGLTDIVLVTGNAVCYWPSLGYGDFGPRVAMGNAPRLPDDYDPQRLLIGDVNGDGLADLVYVDDRRVTLWLNRSGNAWSDPIVVEGTPPVLHSDALRLVDLLGSGVSGVLWTSDRSASTRDHYFFLDFTGSAKPYMLASMTNQLGAVTRVEFRPSTFYYLEDSKDAKTRWQTSLPFPVQVVARVEVEDALSGGTLVTEYSYHHGYWDGLEREFRGFGRVEQRDAEVFRSSGDAADSTYTPPLLTKQWFDQGAVAEAGKGLASLDLSSEFWPGDTPQLDQAQRTASALAALAKALADLPTTTKRRAQRDALRSLRGTVVRSELFALDAAARASRPYTVTERQFDFEERAPPASANAERLRIFAPFLRVERTTQWERGDEPQTQFVFTPVRDEFGQVLSKTQVGCPRGWRQLDDRPSQPYLATRELTAYAAPDADGAYIHDRVARVDQFELSSTNGATLAELVARPDGDPTLVRYGQTLSFYDGEAFTGLALGRAGAYGARSRVETLVLTPERLAAAYGTQIPPYLLPGALVWPADYPAGVGNVATFRNTVPALAGYVFHSGTEAGLGEVAAGLFACSDLVARDFQTAPADPVRGLVTRGRDPMGGETRLAYADELLLASVTDAAELTTLAEYDARFFKANRVTDPNGNISRFDLGPDGLVSRAWISGKSAAEGDSTRASIEYGYDWFAFQARSQPVFVSTRRYEHHDTEAGLGTDQLLASIETREYSDGFGRLLQTRVQGEEVRFGDPVFGTGVVPEDQSTAALAAVAGRFADPGAGPHVTVSGWQRYDNKGQVVESYEPFFSQGWDYAPVEDDQKGERLRSFYDPRGHVVRRQFPDGSEGRVVYGVPGSVAAPDLTNPDVFEPTPWETYEYDTSDNAGRTHAAAAVSYRHVWNTPRSVEIDAFGRMVRSVERNRDRAPSLSSTLDPPVEVTTRFAYDIRGNLLSTVDALNRVAFSYSYDLAQHALSARSLDAGERWIVLNAAGLELERRDSKGALVLQQYDVLNRPKRLWARDAATSAVTLRQVVTYGDELPAAAAPAERNLLGQPHLQQDGAGSLTFDRYDLNGRLLESTRSVIADAAIAAQVDAAATPAPGFTVDWDSPPALAGSYVTTQAYDALGRVVSARLPEDEDGERKELVPAYNRAGALESVSLAGDVYVSRVAYDAKGQRVLVAYGNGCLSRYAYDRRTFRLTRLRTERYRLAVGAPGVAPSYEPLGGVLQDFGYSYDLSGNILSIADRSPGSGVAGAPLGDDALDRVFEYDAMARLTYASGREALTQASFPRTSLGAAVAALDRSPYTDGTAFAQPGSTTTPELAPQQTGLWRERYRYDPAGNLLELRHQSGTRPAWTRAFGMGGFTPAAWAAAFPPHADGDAPWVDPPSNRATHVGDDLPTTPETHQYDEVGNLTRENGTRFFAWNHADQLVGFSVRANAVAAASVETCYLYDSAGQRVKKWVRRGTRVETSIYVGSAYERHDDGTTANSTLHVLDGKNRIAIRRVGPAFADEGAPELTVKYHFSDHLGSSQIVVGVAANGANVLVNREEFYPYGETSYGGFTRKRYRFTGMERDEESGLHYHGARYYAPWLGRWLSPDPGGPQRSPQLYAYAAGNPLGLVDPNGKADEPAADAGTTHADPAPNLVYSKSPEGAAKRALDDSLREAGIKIDIHGADYWRAVVGALGSQVELRDFPLSTEGYQLFYVKGGLEGFLPREQKSRNADAIDFSGFGVSDLNDALIVFDRKGERFLGAIPMVRPQSAAQQAEMNEWAAHGAPVFVYYNTHWGYEAISVMSVHKLSYESGKGKSVPAPAVSGVWVDFHAASHGTLGCIGVADKDVATFNAIYRELARYSADGGAGNRSFAYTGRDGKPKFVEFPGHASVGTLRVLSVLPSDKPAPH